MSKRKYLQERRKKEQQRKVLVLVSMILGSLIVLSAVTYAFINASRVNLSEDQIVKPEFSSSILANQNSLGNPAAPVLIEEYSDFGCLHCANFALETKKTLEEQYIKEGKVSLVFHSVGELLGSPSTMLAAEAAYCAADQDAFWPYHDLLFANQSALFQNVSASISPTLETFADILELDLEVFKDCLSSGKYRSKLDQDYADAQANNITGTPSFLINGVLLRGNQPIESFQRVIEEELAKSLQE
jgi:protein-disulfide isomerase